MKIIIIIILLICFKSFGQITIRENEIIERPVKKPNPFDSLANIEYKKNHIDYNQYVGQKLYFISKSKKHIFERESDTLINFLYNPKYENVIKKVMFSYKELNIQYTTLDPNSKYDAELYNTGNQKYLNSINGTSNVYSPYFIQRKFIGGQKIEGDFYTKRNKVEGKYFTILDVLGRKPSNDFNKYEKLEDLNEIANLKFVLKNDETNDTIHWNIIRPYYISQSPFFLVSYFTKLKKLYGNKKMIAMNNFNTVEINSGKELNILKNDKWDCIDFSFVDIESSSELTPFFILKNSTGEEIKLKIKDIQNELLITEELYLDRENKRKLKEEEIKKIQIEEENKIAKDSEEFRLSCVKKYGNKYGNLISEGNIVIGMTKNMCELSWGNPIYINTTTIKGLIVEQWVYNWKNYLYFRNNELTAIQN